MESNRRVVVNNNDRNGNNTNNNDRNKNPDTGGFPLDQRVLAQIKTILRFCIRTKSFTTLRDLVQMTEPGVKKMPNRAIGALRYLAKEDFDNRGPNRTSIVVTAVNKTDSVYPSDGYFDWTETLGVSLKDSDETPYWKENLKRLGYDVSDGISHPLLTSFGVSFVTLSDVPGQSKSWNKNTRKYEYESNDYDDEDYEDGETAATTAQSPDTTAALRFFCPQAQVAQVIKRRLAVLMAEMKIPNAFSCVGYFHFCLFSKNFFILIISSFFLKREPRCLFGIDIFICFANFSSDSTFE